MQTAGARRGAWLRWRLREGCPVNGCPAAAARPFRGGVRALRSSPRAGAERGKVGLPCAALPPGVRSSPGAARPCFPRLPLPQSARRGGGRRRGVGGRPLRLCRCLPGSGAAAPVALDSLRGLERLFLSFSPAGKSS